MNDSDNTEFYRRLDNLERKVDITSNSLISHLASCERLGQSATESRARVELAVAALSVKLDSLMTRQSEQNGAMKFSRWLWSAIVAIGAFIGWSAAHFAVIR